MTQKSLHSLILAIISSLALLPACSAHSTPAVESAAQPQQTTTPVPPYRGWGHLVEKLKKKGVDAQRVETVFNDARMPEFSLITFKLQPVESSSIYIGFRTVKKLNEGRAFLRASKALFDKLGQRYSVNPEIITAILMVETHFGENTGKEMILNRLARVSSVGEPETLWKNFELIKKDNPQATFEQVQKRAVYLEETFLPEVVALFKMCELGKLDIFSIKGSSAGAFGFPQFLPSSYLSFAVDGNNDGTVSLYNMPDAIYSIASFLTHYGWKPTISEKEKRAVIWNYNRSQAYVDTIFWLATGMSHRRI